ncbi:MAG: guanylate kinase [Bacillota bacterium]
MKQQGQEQGVLLIISGPSGSGKGTVVEQLAKDDTFALSISATTRQPRQYEVHGEHYFFYDQKQFQEMKDARELLEWAEFCGNFYGTPKKYAVEHLKSGKNVILEIEVQGALQVKQMYPEGVLIFMVPPTLEELGKRLSKRGTEDKEIINQRITRALEELELMERYDYLVVNREVKEAVEDIYSIVSAEKLRCTRNLEIKKEFKGEN